MKKIKQSQRQTGCYQEYKYMYNGESQKKTETAKRIFKEVIPEERVGTRIFILTCLRQRGWLGLFSG